MAAGATEPASVATSQGFSPSERVRKRFEFRRIREIGRRVHTKSFLVLVAPRDEPGVRLGLTVSRHVGNAVRRNRVKRLVREVFRQHRELFPAQADVVVIAKNSCSLQAFGEVYAEFAQAAQVLKTPRRGRPGGNR